MTKLLLLLFAFILLIPQSILSQTESKNFPDDWLGIWQGNLKIYNKAGEVNSVDMEIQIQEMEEEGRWHWTLIYKGEKTDERKYELVAINEEEGHYQIDEKNSILLDAYWRNQTLISRFSVNNSLLLINYHFEEAIIRFEVFSGSLDKPQITGEEVEGVEKIQSFPIGVMQRAILRKK